MGRSISCTCSSRKSSGRGGWPDKTAQLVIQAYPVLVLSNEWLEELYCPQCGSSHWCHVIQHNRVEHTVRWAPRDLWQQVAHVDPSCPNPTVSEYTRRSARRTDGRRLWDPMLAAAAEHQAPIPEAWR